NVHPGDLSPTVTDITVTGGDPTASDELVVNGTAGSDVVDYRPSGAASDAGTVDITGLAPITFDTIENLVYNGLGGNDTVSVTTVAGPDLVTLTAGAAIDAGTITSTRLVGAPSSAAPLSYSNLGAGGTLTFANDNAAPARQDTLTYNGTANNDT